MVKIIKQLQAGDRLQGGVFHNDNIFQPVYQMLLALHTAAFCCLSAKVQLPSILPLLQQAAEELSEVTLHPVLAAMLANTVTVWDASEADIVRKVSLACTHAFVDDPAAMSCPNFKLSNPVAAHHLIQKVLRSRVTQNFVCRGWTGMVTCSGATPFFQEIPSCDWLLVLHAKQALVHRYEYVRIGRMHNWQ